MNEKNLLLILGIIVLIALTGLVSTYKQSSTGMVVPGMPVAQKPLLTGAEHEGWYKVECLHHIQDFFKIKEFAYPQKNKCARVIEETCNQLKKMKTSKIETFIAGQQNAYKLMIFEVAGELLGKITLIKGFETPDAAELYLTLDKTIFTIRGWHENIELDITLKGKKIEDTMIWQSGNITAEDFECQFGQ